MALNSQKTLFCQKTKQIKNKNKNKKKKKTKQTKNKPNNQIIFYLKILFFSQIFIWIAYWNYWSIILHYNIPHIQLKIQM